MKNRGAMAVTALVQAVIGYEWVKAGWEKVSDPHFVAGMGPTLSAFASKNPTSWYKDLLTGIAFPNATTFGWLVGYAEFVIGIVLLVAAAVYLVFGARFDPFSRFAVPIVAVVALIGGAFLNANFWFVAGWLSVSTDSVNAVMFLTQLVLAGATIYSLIETAKHEREEENAWEQLFNPARTELAAPREPAGIAR